MNLKPLNPKRLHTLRTEPPVLEALPGAAWLSEAPTLAPGLRTHGPIHKPIVVPVPYTPTYIHVYIYIIMYMYKYIYIYVNTSRVFCLNPSVGLGRVSSL